MVMGERELVDMVLVRYWAGRLEEEDRKKLWQFLYGYNTNKFLCQDNGYLRENGGMKLSRNCFMIPEDSFESVEIQFNKYKVVFDILGKIKAEPARRYIVSYKRMAIWTVLSFAYLMRLPLEILIHPVKGETLSVINSEIYEEPAKFSLKTANLVAARYCTNFSGGGEEQLRWALEFVKKHDVEHSARLAEEGENFKDWRSEDTAFYDFATHAVNHLPDEPFSFYLKQHLKIR
jgi:hypothetical protein